MTVVDWTDFALGAGAGGLAGLLFFAGLAAGLRWALRRDAPMKILALSAALRVAALLAAGWVVLSQWGPWAAIGYGFAFLAVRLIATTIARPGIPMGARP